MRDEAQPTVQIILMKKDHMGPLPAMHSVSIALSLLITIIKMEL